MTVNKKRIYTQLAQGEIAVLQKKRNLRNGTTTMIEKSGLSRLTLQRAWEGLVITTETANTIRKKLLDETGTDIPANKSPLLRADAIAAEPVA